MVKVLSQYVPGRLFVLLVTENILIILGVWVALSLDTGRFQLALLSYPALLTKALLITVICQLCFYLNDLYDLKSIGSPLEMALRLLKTLGMASLLLAFLYLVIPQARLGSGIVEISVVAIALIILLWRVLVEWFHGAYGARERILIVGSGANAQALAREVRGRQDLRIEMVGLVSDNGGSPEGAFCGAPCLGGLETFNAIVRQTRPRRVVVAMEERRDHLPMDALLNLRLRGVPVEYANTFYEKLAGRIPIESIHPSDLVFSDIFYGPHRPLTYRRILGAAGSLLGMVLFGPLMALIAVAIKLESPGPALYRQDRVGLDGHVFEILKFRSMRADAESETGPVWAERSDARTTRVGGLLRKLRLDELPQLVNILRGEMNFIGPRPERPCFVEMLHPQIPFYDVRHVIRPGVTGWAQVSYEYSSCLEEAKEKFEYDLFYLKNMSLSLDLLILFQTFKIAILGRGAR